MATIGNTVLTLADHAKRMDPSGKTAAIVELLQQANPILEDIPFSEGNLPTGHRTTVRTGLPTVYWRLINAGVQPSKSTTAQVDEHSGMLEAWSEVDKDLAELNADLNAFRLSEASPFFEAMAQEMAQTLFYGNSGTAPEEFNGLAIRYSDIGSGSPASSQNVIDAGGTGSDNSSIWLVIWGENAYHGVFPKGSKAGIIHEDLGLVTVQTATGIGGGRMRAYQDHWQWKAGLVGRDWRYAVRVANIDISNLTAESSAADLIKAMIRAFHRIPDGGFNRGRAVWYMNRTVFQMLDIQRYNAIANGGAIDYMTVDGKSIPTFRQIPIRVTDALLETEARVV